MNTCDECYSDECNNHSCLDRADDMFPIVRDYRDHMAKGRMLETRKAKLIYDVMNRAARKQIVDFGLPSLPLWVLE